MSDTRSALAFTALALLLASTVLIPCTQAATPLPASTVMSSPLRILRMANDPWEGGVWIGTEGGLLFKDLETGALRHYSIPNGLPHFAVNDIVAEPEHTWVATSWGVAVLDKRTQALDLVMRPDGQPLKQLARTLFADGEGIWLGTDAAGLFLIDRTSGVATSVPNPENGTTFRHAIYGLGAVGPELYISANGHGLIRWNRTTGETWRYDDVAFSPKPYFGRIDVSQKEVWIGSLGDGVLQLTRANWALSQYASPDTSNAHVVYRPVKAFGKTWFPTHNGVALRDDASGQWRTWHTVPGGESVNEIVFADGEVYGATDRATVVRYDRAQSDWVAVDWWGGSQTMRHNLVNSCAVEAPGRLMFGTAGGGAHLFDAQSGRWSVVGREPGARGAPNDINILSTASDATTRFFTHYNGVSEADLASGTYRNFYVDGRTQADKRWGFNIVRDVAIDDQVAWFATKTNHEKQLQSTDPIVWHPGKITRYDRATHTMTLYGAESGLSDGNVSSLALDGERLWIGMDRGGVDVLDTATGTIQHVLPASGQLSVKDLIIAHGYVWAAAFGGVLRIDPETLQASTVSLGEALPLSLESASGRIWVGTYYGGLFEVDPQTLSTTHYGAPGPLDRVVYCIAADGATLYLGTGWGVERFGLADRAFLDQVVVPGAPAAAAERVISSIAITAPDGASPLSPGAVRVAGQASGAVEGATVLVRFGDGAWVTASGVESWSATVDPSPGASSSRISARLEQGGRLLAQDFVEVQVAVPGAVPGVGQAGPDGSPAAAQARFLHDPLTDAHVGDVVRLVVTPQGDYPDLTATVSFAMPGTTGRTLPLQREGNSLVAQLPRFTEAGEGAYAIAFSWEGGIDRLPAAFSEQGDTYRFVVRDVAAAQRPRVVDPGDLRVQAGTPSELRLMVQNPSLQALQAIVHAEGIAGITADGAPLDLPAGGSAPLMLLANVSADHAPAFGEVTVRLRAIDGTLLATSTLDVTVVGADGSVPAAGTPSPAWVALVALVLGAAVGRRSACR